MAFSTKICPFLYRDLAAAAALTILYFGIAGMDPS